VLLIYKTARFRRSLKELQIPHSRAILEAWQLDTRRFQPRLPIFGLAQTWSAQTWSAQAISARENTCRIWNWWTNSTLF